MMLEMLSGKTLEEIKSWLLENGFPKYAAEQIWQWIYQKGVLDWSKMTNLSKTLREALTAHFVLPCLQQIKAIDSQDQETTKFLWKLHDEKLIESVLIRSAERRTVCVSSQVGCPAKCAFCASGKKGLFRSLDTAEIIEQILLIDQYLQKTNEKVTHVVFMGMGEPLDNYENVVKALKIINHPNGLNISQRRITVSTVGIVENIYKLAESGLKVSLVLSLHAPNQHIRKKIIPYARRYDLEDVLNATDHYAKMTKRDLTYEYTLLKGINDHKEHAEELAHLIGSRQCAVNLIPYNPVEGLNLYRPDTATIRVFREILDKKGIVNTCRYTKGDDIAAACGQLALQTQEVIVN